MSLRLIGAIALLAIMGGVWWHGFDSGRDRWEGKYDAEVAAHAAEVTAHRATKEEHARRARHVADLAKAAKEESVRNQRIYDARTAANDTQHKKELANAVRKRDAVIADLRAGALQLQPWWESGAGACPGQAAVAADTSGQADAWDLRAAGAGDLVQILHEADADRQWYIDELTATRAQCGSTGPAL